MTDGCREKPAALQDVPASRCVELDVREALARGEEPLSRIMRVVKALEDDQVLLLRSTFEPHPLYSVLARRGFRHWSEGRGDDWSVWFYRDRGAEQAISAPASRESGKEVEPERLVLDVRRLEAPEPMLRVLERLDALQPGQCLEVLHARRPIFLYPLIEERGLRHETDEPEPGIVRIVVTKPSR